MPPNVASTDFSARARARPHAAGLWLSDGVRVLLVLRAHWLVEPNTWSVPGGLLDASETPEQAARRECLEEVGHLPPYALRDVEDVGTYQLLVADVEPEDLGWTPVLNDEHTDWVWADRAWIQAHWNDLHPGLREILTRFQEKTAKGYSGNLLQRFCRETPDAGALDAESLAMLFLGAGG